MFLYLHMYLASLSGRHLGHPKQQATSLHLYMHLRMYLYLHMYLYLYVHLHLYLHLYLHMYLHLHLYLALYLNLHRFGSEMRVLFSFASFNSRVHGCTQQRFILQWCFSAH